MLSGSLVSTLLEAYPELRGQDELVNLIWNDLAYAGLHSSSSLKALMTGDGILVPRTSRLGNEFLQFITEK